MSEIEKMYENAGIKPYIYCSKPQLDCDARENGNCRQDCEFYSGEKFLTSFTAEKQIELIKFLLKNYEGVDISKKINRFNFLVDNATFSGCRHNDKSFEESLAGVINKLWADMSEEEKQQVKGILE